MPPPPPPPTPALASNSTSARTVAPSRIMNKTQPPTNKQAVQNTTKKRFNHHLFLLTYFSRLAKEARDIVADPPIGIRYYSYTDVDLLNISLVPVRLMTVISCVGVRPSLVHKDHRISHS